MFDAGVEPPGADLPANLLDRACPNDSADGYAIAEPRLEECMTDLSPATWQKIRQLFHPALHEEVAALLEKECGNNLPFLERVDADALDRFRFAALKLSNGNLEMLNQAIDLAKTDWRDLLIYAGFADSVDAHRQWCIGDPLPPTTSRALGWTKGMK
jgi:hypothetical protein